MIRDSFRGSEEAGRVVRSVDNSNGGLLSSKEAEEDKGEAGAYSRLAAFQIFFFPACGGLLFGYDIGATSAVIPQLCDADYSGVKWHQMVDDSAFLQGAITSSELIGAMLGCIICFKVADDMGRRRGLMLASVLFFIGAIFLFI
jgi:hypothetical protein